MTDYTQPVQATSNQRIGMRFKKIGVDGLKVLTYVQAPCYDELAFTPHGGSANGAELITRIRSWARARGIWEQLGTRGSRGPFWRAVGAECRFGPPTKQIMYGNPWIVENFFDQGIRNTILNGRDPDGNYWFTDSVRLDPNNLAAAHAYFQSMLHVQLGADHMWVPPLAGEVLRLPYAIISPVAMAPDIEADILRWSAQMPEHAVNPLPFMSELDGKFVSYDTLLDRVSKFGKLIYESSTAGHTMIRAHRVALGQILETARRGSWVDAEIPKHPVIRWYLSLGQLGLMLEDADTIYDIRAYDTALNVEALLNHLTPYISEADRGTPTSRARLGVVPLREVVDKHADCYRTVSLDGSQNVCLTGGAVIPRIGGHENVVIVAQPNVDANVMWLARRPDAEAVMTAQANALEDAFNTQALSRLGQVVRNVGTEPDITIITATSDGRMAYLCKLSYCESWKPVPANAQNTASALLGRYSYKLFRTEFEALARLMASRPGEYETHFLDVAFILSEATPTIVIDGSHHAADPTFGIPSPIDPNATTFTRYIGGSVDLRPLYIAGADGQAPGAQPIAVQYRRYTDDSLANYVIEQFTVDAGRMYHLASQETNICYVPSRGHGVNVNTGLYVLIQSIRAVLGHVPPEQLQKYVAQHVSMSVIEHPVLRGVMEEFSTQAGLNVTRMQHTREFATFVSLFFAGLFYVHATTALGTGHYFAVLGQLCSIDGDHLARQVFAAYMTGMTKPDASKLAYVVRAVARDELRPLNTKIATPQFTAANQSIKK
jgi:hypothetical protein